MWTRIMFFGLVYLTGLAGCETYYEPQGTTVGKRCVPKSCDSIGVSCGKADDGCGGLIHCGSCASPFFCDEGIGECVCEVKCSGRCGGSDGCGGTCNTPCSAPETCGGGGVPNYCGCTPVCVGRCAGDDGCGGECTGGCPFPLTCGGADDVEACGCTPDCTGRCDGASDGCFGRCFSICEGFETCGGGGRPGRCGCTPDCEGKCGGPDGCGGECFADCEAPTTCGGGSEPNVCGCTVHDCATLLGESGTPCGVFKRCGQVVDCPGSCGDTGEVCDDWEGVCCTPVDCTGRCGPDGCGGTCGACTGLETCGGAGVSSTCGVSPAACTGDGWCFNFPRPAGVNIHDVWVAGSQDAWAVGDYGTVLRYGADGWSRVASGTRAHLRGVFGADPATVWMVGFGGTVLRWTEVGGIAPVDVGVTRHLYDVWVNTATGQVWAVGQAGQVSRSNGAGWDTVPVIGTTGLLNTELRMVWGLPDGSAVWFGGIFGRLFEFSNDSFAEQQTGVFLPLNGVWGAATDDVWVVGGNGVDESVLLHRGSTGGWTAGSLGERYNGEARNPAALHAVWGSGTDDVWVTGVDLGGGGFAARFDGLGWSSLPVSDRVWRSGSGAASNLHLVGDRGAMTQWSAEGWVDGSHLPPRASFLNTGIVALHGSGADSLWGVSSQGEAWHGEGPTGPWTVESLGDDWRPTDLWVTPEGSVWAVGTVTGAGGQVIAHRSAGGTWQELHRDPDGPALSTVWAASDTEVWAGGHGGVLLRRQDAGLFGPVAAAVTGDVHDIFGLGADRIWVATQDGVLAWDGAQFSSLPTPPAAPRAVWAATATDVWVGLSSGIARYVDGVLDETVVQPDFGVGSTAVAIGLWGVDASNLWLTAAINGSAESNWVGRYDGTVWIPADTGAHGTLWGVFGDAATSTVWLGGVEGVFVKAP